jgi:hypothetical protein
MEEKSPRANDFNKKWAKIIAKAWADENFKNELLKNPSKVFKENGIELPSGTSVEVREYDPKKLHLTLPTKPGKEISEEKLSNIFAGQQTLSGCNWSCQCSFSA